MQNLNEPVHFSSLLTCLTSVLLNSLILIATYLKLDSKAGAGEAGSYSDLLV